MMRLPCAITLPSFNPLDKIFGKFFVPVQSTIFTNKPLKSCKDGNVDNLDDLALAGHELVHAYQIQGYGRTAFLIQYLAEYTKNRELGLNDQDAYACIPFEIDGHAFQNAVKKVL